MEQWHYDPTVDVDQTLLDGVPREPGLLVRGVRSLTAVALRCWLRLYHRLTIVGRQNLPTDRSFLLISNHTSHLDTLCLLSALPFSWLHRTYPAAAKDYFCQSAGRALLASVVVNAVPFERRLAPWQSLSVCAGVLRKPDAILILFPEGTRSDGGEPGEFKPGVALLAAAHGIPVVPCHLAGTHAALPKGRWCPRPNTVRLTIGRPRLYAHVPATKEAAKQICCELREAVILLGQEASESGVVTPSLESGAIGRALLPLGVPREEATGLT